MSPSRKRLFLVVNGILTPPSDTQAWTDRAVIWIETQTSYKATAYEYFCGPLFRRMGQAKRVKEVVNLIRSYALLDIVLVGHSNGADIISRILLQSNCKIREVHLVAGACERDCGKNGINAAIMDHRLDHAYIYCSTGDTALKLARNTGKFLSWFGVGYGTMGLDGPVNVGDSGRVTTLWNNDLDHSDMWKPEHFEATMRLITHRPKMT